MIIEDGKTPKLRLIVRTDGGPSAAPETDGSTEGVLPGAAGDGVARGLNPGEQLAQVTQPNPSFPGILGVAGYRGRDERAAELAQAVRAAFAGVAEDVVRNLMKG